MHSRCNGSEEPFPQDICESCIPWLEVMMCRAGFSRTVISDINPSSPPENTGFDRRREQDLRTQPGRHRASRYNQAQSAPGREDAAQPLAEVHTDGFGRPWSKIAVAWVWTLRCADSRFSKLHPTPTPEDCPRRQARNPNRVTGSSAR